jgi:hypothetical protein
VTLNIFEKNKYINMKIIKEINFPIFVNHVSIIRNKRSPTVKIGKTKPKFTKLRNENFINDGKKTKITVYAGIRQSTDKKNALPNKISKILYW